MCDPVYDLGSEMLIAIDYAFLEGWYCIFKDIVHVDVFLKRTEKYLNLVG